MQLHPNARWIPVALAMLALAILLMSGTGTRLGIWNYRMGFTMLKWGAYIGILAAIVAIGVLVVARPTGVALAVTGIAAVVAIVTIFTPWQWRRAVQHVPPIHDITTDLGNPPAFEAILPLRADAPNAAEYGGPEVAAQQRAGYPDIEPLFMEITPGAAFERALASSREMGWEIITADSSRGRIEAVATTRWFGFKDDVVVRIAPDGSRSRVDVRSVSRVGGSDVGTNARRIRDFLGKLKN